MEELIILPCILAIKALLGVVEALIYFACDLVGIALGHGWGHYSKKRAAAKAEKKRLKETFK